MMALLVYNTAAAAAGGPRSSMAQGPGGIRQQPNTVGIAPPHTHKRRFRAMATSEGAGAGAGAGAVVGRVTEVNTLTFWPIVEAAAGTNIVVLDMYTQWCGPCKVIAPKFKELCQKYDDVVFLKLDCNPENRPLVKELGLRVVPTFKIFKDGKVVKEVTGAKIDNLIAAIDNVRSTS